MIITIIETIYRFLWGDFLQIPLPGGGSVGISLLIILLIPVGIYFTIRTRVLPVRLFSEMVKALLEKKKEESSLSTFQTLIVSTATRVGMGNLVGVVAAISAGGAGAVFWMWITAVIGSSTAFIEATLAQLYKEKDPLYGGYRGGPAYYIHHYIEDRQGTKKKHVLLAVLFAISGLICWCGISQVISNSVASSFENAFSIPPFIYYDRSGYSGSVYCVKKECDRESSGCNCTNYGSVLFCNHRFSDHDTHSEPAGCIFQNFQRSIWLQTGSCRWLWGRDHEWSEEGTVL